MVNRRARTWMALCMAVCLTAGCEGEASKDSGAAEGTVEDLAMDFAPRPDEVGGEGAAAVVVALAGEAKIRGVKGKEFGAAPGHPLTPDDVVMAPEGSFVLVLLRNGHLVRVDPERIFAVVSDFELTHPSPATRSIGEQLKDIMSSSERKQAGADFAAKVAGYQRTLTGDDKPAEAEPAPEISDTPPVAPEKPEEKPTEEKPPETDTGKAPVPEKQPDEKKTPVKKKPVKTKTTKTTKTTKKAAKPAVDDPEPAKKAGPITWSIHSGGDKTPKGPLPAVLRKQQSLLRGIVADAVEAHPNLGSTVRVVMQIKESTITKVAIDGVHPTPGKLKSGFVGKPISEIAGPVWIVVKVPR